MSMDAVGRVPIADWLMGLAVLVCGVAGIVAAWRYADQLGGAGAAAQDGPDEGGGHGEREVPLALPPGPANGATPPDAIDAELWSIIDAERVRLRVKTGGRGADRIAAHETFGPSARTLHEGEAA